MSQSPPFVCRICSAEVHTPRIEGRERMFGMNESFAYRECPSCGCVQIEEIPPDLGRYYADDYYSMSPVRETLPRVLMKLLRARNARGRSAILGGLVRRFVPLPPLPRWFGRLSLSFAAPVLDVGCGVGQFLLALRNAGYTNLRGADPFVPDEIRYAGGVRIWKRTIEQVTGAFALVTMLDSFEHMPAPLSALREARRLVGTTGTVLVRIPVIGYAWREYRENWVQLDPPRHLHLHTKRSLEQVARAAGLKVVDVVDDSTSFQFWGSEQWQRGIPYMGPESIARNPRGSIFTAAQIAAFERRAEELNAAADGDTACFFLRAA